MVIDRRNPSARPTRLPRRHAPSIDDTGTALGDADLEPVGKFVQFGRCEHEQRVVRSFDQSSVRRALVQTNRPLAVPEPSSDLPVGVVPTVRPLENGLERERYHEVATPWARESELPCELATAWAIRTAPVIPTASNDRHVYRHSGSYGRRLSDRHFPPSVIVNGTRVQWWTDRRLQ